jgi:hypothetical protein
MPFYSDINLAIIVVFVFVFLIKFQKDLMRQVEFKVRQTFDSLTLESKM